MCRLSCDAHLNYVGVKRVEGVMEFLHCRLLTSLTTSCRRFIGGVHVVISLYILFVGWVRIRLFVARCA